MTLKKLEMSIVPDSPLGGDALKKVFSMDFSLPVKRPDANMIILEKKPCIQTLVLYFRVATKLGIMFQLTTKSLIKSYLGDSLRVFLNAQIDSVAGGMLASRFWAKSFGCLCLLFTAVGVHAQQNHTLTFEKPENAIFEGQDFTSPISLKPVPTSGLFSFSMRVSVESNVGVSGFVSVNPVAGLNFNGPFAAGAATNPAEGEGIAQGTADFFVNPPGGLHLAEKIADVRISGLAAGNYTLRLTPYYTLGLKEDVFIDGANESLDDQINFGSANLTVTKTYGTIAEQGAATLNNQTGLYNQTVTLTNTSGAQQDGFRVWVDGLGANTSLRNAHGTVDGRPYIDYTGILASGASVNLTLEYYVSDRGGAPSVTYDVKPPNDDANPPAVVNIVSIQPRLTFQATGSVLVEFKTQSGKSYLIEYSSNMVDWKSALPTINGTGQNVQWIDNGPPRTLSHPSQVSSRFYRLSEIAP